MPRQITGEVRRTEGGFSARVRLGSKRETFELPNCRTTEQATERTSLLAHLARRFASSPTARDEAVEVLRLIAASDERSLAIKRTLADELLGGELVKDDGPSVPTFGQVVDAWVSGELAKAFPHQIKQAGSDWLATTKSRSGASCFDGIRDVPVHLITRRMCDDVMREVPVPKGKTAIGGNTLRQYAVLINRVFRLAELAGYIARSPIPSGWLPKPAPRKRFPILYPDEDRALLAAPASKVPLVYRVLYGFLHREGVRLGEAAALQIRDVDFERETIALDENKTDHPRFWKLSPGVAAALAAYVELAHGAEPDDVDEEAFLFVEAGGGALNTDHLAEKVRAHLKAAGIDRADLFSSGPNKGHFGVHSFRRSMVTRSLALGLGEDWVRQRTGHTTDELLRYRQGAKALAELQLTDLAPLKEAISELVCPLIAPRSVGAARFELTTPSPPD